MRVLLTGAAGSIGRVLATALPALGHDLVGLDLVADPGTGLPWHRADCTDPVAVAQVVTEVRPEAVVHLAGIPTESSLPDALATHVVTTGALLEAMVAVGATRMIYAGSNHAVGRTPRDVGTLTTDVRPRPDTFYGTAKVAAEALMSLYADRHGMDVVSLRIGSFLERPTTRRNLSTWLSPADTVRMVDAVLRAPSPGYAVAYGVSANTRGWWDLGPGHALGYHPQDDAEDFAAEIEAVSATATDQAEAAHVGGPYATEVFARPPFD